MHIVTSKERIIAAASQIIPIVPFFLSLTPLTPLWKIINIGVLAISATIWIIYDIKKVYFISDHAKESFNFEINIALLVLIKEVAYITGLLDNNPLLTLSKADSIQYITNNPTSIYSIMALATALLIVSIIILRIIASYKALLGKLYRYPLVIRFIK